MKRFLLPTTKLPWALLCIWLSHRYATHHLPEAWIAGVMGGILSMAGMMVLDAWTADKRT